MKFERYERQLAMADVGKSGQRKLLDSHVAVVGAGGLGYPILAYLAAAGVGQLTIVDDDTVSMSNLNRQLFYNQGDLGQTKALRAAQVLRGLNPTIDVREKVCHIDDATADDCLSGADLVIDAVDNVPARHVVNRWAHATRTPVMFGAVEGWEASLLFHLPADPTSPCYECAFPSLPTSTRVVPVIGATAGVVGTLQATRALRWLLGLPVSADSLVVLDVKRECLRTVRARPRPSCPCRATADTRRGVVA